MAKANQYGCKKCGSVITVEVQPRSDRIEVKINEGSAQDRLGETEITCKKCRNAVLKLSIVPK